MRVLIVEDSERLRRSLGKGLQGMGLAVDLAADGREGLEFARAYEYDVIVLDLMLPQVDGLSILKELRKSGSAAHVIVPPQEGPHMRALADWLDDAAQLHPCHAEVSYAGFELLMGMALSSLERRKVEMPIEPLPQTPILTQLKEVLHG